MNFAEYSGYDALGLAELVAKGEVTAGELLDLALARMEEVNPQVNAVVLTFAERARQATNIPAHGPFGGVPFLLKDLGAQLHGTVTSQGSRVFKNAIANEDNAIVSSYRSAGLNVFGKTNTPEFGLTAVTEPALFGPTRNPWDLTRTCGGSSGGAAAAVAAGIVPAAHASDGGGSIRTPSSCCGLFGMKPSRGRVSFAPQGEGWAGASVAHAVTRSVRDSAALLDAVCQPRPGDPYFMAPPERPFLEEMKKDPGKLRIAFTPAGLMTPEIDPECVSAVYDSAALCESLGHEVEQVNLQADFQGMSQAAGTVIAASIAALLDAEAERRSAAIGEDEVEPLTMAMYKRGKGVTGSEYVRALQFLHGFSRTIASFFQAYDVLLLSTLGRPPIPLGWLTEDYRRYTERLFAFMPNTQAFNNTGQPAMSVPLYWTSDGLPIGTQFVGKMGQEAMLFQLAAQLEQAKPWFDKRPIL
ncbi:amidase [Phenylobacterium sp.]|uniref:amidase n=1 Tax=Phenylobacterium sp. TaxID=1871053 RepID=UPI0035B18F7E